MSIPESLERFLKSVGVIKEAIKEFRFGEGFVGRHTQTAIATIAGLCFFAYFIHTEWMLFLLALSLLAIFGRYSFITYKFAEAHPDHALMEGGTLATWQKMQLAAKDTPLPLSGETLIGRPDDSSESLNQASSNLLTERMDNASSSDSQ